MNWKAWSRDSLALMQARNEAWPKRYGIEGASYTLRIDCGQIHFSTAEGNVVSSVCLIGTTSECEGTFLWAWANDSIPEVASVDLDAVRSFGKKNELSLLIEPEIDGGKPEALELAAISGRILDAEGIFIHPDQGRLFFFLLRSFERIPGSKVN